VRQPFAFYPTVWEVTISKNLPSSILTLSFLQEKCSWLNLTFFNVNKYVPAPQIDVFFSHVNFSQVAGIKGMFLANKKIENQVKTFITYNKGRDWRLLQAPDTDLRGDPVHCLLVSLHDGANNGVQ
jgi:hypothetical protein